MSKRILFAILILSFVTGLALTGCDEMMDLSETPSSLPEAQQQATLAPADLPTAAPIWTATSSSGDQAASGQQQPAGQPADLTIAATINGVTISRAQYEQQLAQAQTNWLQQPGLDLTSPEGQEQIRQLEQQVLSWMIDQVLIEQAAAAHGVQVTDAKIDAEIARMRGNDQARFDSWLAANGLTLESLRSQIRNDLITTAMRDIVTASTPRQADQFHVRHILLSDENTAQAVLAQARQGADFAALARQYSEDQATREQGGDLGFVPRGVMPSAFEQAAFALQPGQVSDIIRSDFGLHIVQMVEIAQGRAVPDELWPAVQQRAFEEWLNNERAKASIQRAF